MCTCLRYSTYCRWAGLHARLLLPALHRLLPCSDSCHHPVQVGEVLDYWGDAGAIAWRLTENDVRQILSQRLDFAPADILALKL